MFTIEKKPLGPFTEFFLRNQKTSEYVSIIPGFGGMINHIVLKKGNQLFELADSCSSYEDLMTEGKIKFKGSKLFPFANRIADGRYTFENKTYQFPINFPQEKNAIHGIVLEKEFIVKAFSADDHEASFTIHYQTSGKEVGYPFKLTLVISYLLNQEGFFCRTEAVSNDDQNILMVDGWHPYFKTGSKMDDCILTLPVEKSYEVNERMIPTGKTKVETTFTSPTKIGDTEFDTGFKLKRPTGENIFCTVLEDPIKEIRLSVWQVVGQYDYLQVYIPPDRMSIAIEPMSGLADAYNNKEGLVILKPGETRNFSFGLKLE